MHLVTVSLGREVPNAAMIDSDALTEALMATTDVARVEHARVVVHPLRVDIVLFLLAPSYSDAIYSARRICQRALDSTLVTGWAVGFPTA